MSKRLIVLGLVAAFAVPVVAQMPTTPPGKPDPKLVEAGTYKIDTNHTQISFGVDHLGFSPYYGTFSGANGKVVLDPANPAAATLDVTVPITSLQTTSTVLTGELKAADWFDAAKFPTASFKSTKVTPTGAATAKVDGNLTLHGVTRPVTIEVRFYGAGTSPMGKAFTVGFEARTEIKRSDYGIAKYIPLVSDQVGLMITAAIEKTG